MGKINELLIPKFNQEFEAWGVYCTRVEVLDFMPSQSVVRQLKLQMLAERNRRAAFIVAEGEAEAKVNLAQAESRALHVVQEAISKDGASQSKYLITGKYLDLMDKVIGKNVGQVDKTIYLPFAVEPIMGFVGTLPKVYGRNCIKNGGNNRRNVPRGRREEKLNDDDLN